VKVVVPLMTAPPAEEKVKVAVFRSRGDELAMSSTLKPLEVTLRTCTLPGEMIGTEAGTASEVDAPVWPVTVSVTPIVPSTVPGAICGRVTEFVSAGIVRLYEVPRPVPELLTNCMAGSA